MGFVIAVDGPAASGKGTIANRLGALLGYPVLDSGLLYRGVGVKLSELGGDLDDVAAATAAAEALEAAELDRSELRTRAAGELASRVAVHTPCAWPCETSSCASRPRSPAR
jgi:cytidylate kinase